MAHFAELDENNKVLRVIVVSNDDCGGGDFPESEPIGQAFLASLGLTGSWLQCSYNNNFRKNHAGIDSYYLPEKDIFIDPKPYPSWVINELGEWDHPTVKRPTADGFWKWNEKLEVWER